MKNLAGSQGFRILRYSCAIYVNCAKWKQMPSPGENVLIVTRYGREALTDVALLAIKRQQKSKVVLIFREMPIISVSKQGKSAAAGFRFLIRNASRFSFPVLLNGKGRDGSDPSKDGA